MESLSKTGYQSIRKGSDDSYEISNSITQKAVSGTVENSGDLLTLKLRKLRGDD